MDNFAAHGLLLWNFILLLIQLALSYTIDLRLFSYAFSIQKK